MVCTPLFEFSNSKIVYTHLFEFSNSKMVCTPLFEFSNRFVWRSLCLQRKDEQTPVFFCSQTNSRKQQTRRALIWACQDCLLCGCDTARISDGGTKNNYIFKTFANETLNEALRSSYCLASKLTTCKQQKEFAITCKQQKEFAVTCKQQKHFAVSCKQHKHFAVYCKQHKHFAVSCKQHKHFAVSCKQHKDFAVSCKQHRHCLQVANRQ